MSIMDIFKPAPAASTDNKQGDNKPEAKTNISDNPNTVDEKGKMPGTNPTDQNPLDAYSKMFDNASSDSEIQAPVFKIDAKTLGEVSGKMDFTRGINPEVLQKATTGDVNALMDIIKTVGQNSYKAAIEHSTSLTDTFLASRGEFESKQLAKGVHSKLTENELSGAPNYQHPVVKKELNRIAAQFAAANPDSSPQEVAKAAKQYINDLQAALNPSTGTDSEEGGKGEMDWTKYLSE